jgi:hypothetical protein
MPTLDIRDLEDHVRSFYTNRERALISIQEANDQFNSKNPSEHPTLLKDSRSMSEHRATISTYRAVDGRFTKEILDK